MTSKPTPLICKQGILWSAYAHLISCLSCPFSQIPVLSPQFLFPAGFVENGHTHFNLCSERLNKPLSSIASCWKICPPLSSSSPQFSGELVSIYMPWWWKPKHCCQSWNQHTGTYLLQLHSLPQVLGAAFSPGLHFETYFNFQVMTSVWSPAHLESALFLPLCIHFLT